jgi:hypothetical protein
MDVKLMKDVELNKERKRSWPVSSYCPVIEENTGRHGKVPR